jgi:hypothetical protein
MARFSMTELDSLSQGSLDRLITLGNEFPLELRVSAAQRAVLVSAFQELCSVVRESHWLRSNPRDTAEMSNFDLYLTLRFNGHDFQRLPTPRAMTLEEADILTDDEIIQLTERGRGVLSLSDHERSQYLQARSAWIETLDEERAEAFSIDDGTASDWNLYAEARINGIPTQAQARVASRSMGM